MPDILDAASADEAAAAKQAVRDAVRAARATLTETERANAARAVAHTVLGLWDLHEAKALMAYLATFEEIDPHPIVDALRVRGLTIAMPRIDEPAGLAVHVVENDSLLVTGPFGVLEPALSTPRLRPDELDVVLVPGVAFDPAGGRIGYGGGFYDQLLPRLRGDCVRIGLAFDEQIVEEVPVQPHDSPVDVVVTPSAVYRRGNAQD